MTETIPLHGLFSPQQDVRTRADDSDSRFHVRVGQWYCDSLTLLPDLDLPMKRLHRIDLKHHYHWPFLTNGES